MQGRASLGSWEKEEEESEKGGKEREKGEKRKKGKNLLEHAVQSEAGCQITETFMVSKD